MCIDTADWVLWTLSAARGEGARVDDRQERPQLIRVEHLNPSELVIGFLTNIR